MLNEGNQIYNFISSSGTGTVINYGSGSASQKVTVPTVPVPQHCQTQNYPRCKAQAALLLFSFLSFDVRSGVPPYFFPIPFPLPGMGLDG